MNDPIKCVVCGRPCYIGTICPSCEKEFLIKHQDDDLKNCPFCNAARENLKYCILAPRYYGAEGVIVVCKGCRARGGVGGIRYRTSHNLCAPYIFNANTVEMGFSEAQHKWNTRS